MENAQDYIISVSENAAKQIKFQLEKRNTPNAYFRLGVKGSGCNGYSYIFLYEDNPPKEKDRVFISNEINIVIDIKSLVLLNGSTIDYETTLIKQGFKILNPNIKSSCGCGKSFST
jgi:iron-sulfur cluster assembly protein